MCKISWHPFHVFFRFLVTDFSQQFNSWSGQRLSFSFHVSIQTSFNLFLNNRPDHNAASASIFKAEGIKYRALKAIFLGKEILQIGNILGAFKEGNQYQIIFCERYMHVIIWLVSIQKTVQLYWISLTVCYPCHTSVVTIEMETPGINKLCSLRVLMEDCSE